MPCGKGKIHSKKQLRKFFAMEERGELPKGSTERKAKKIDVSELPEKAGSFKLHPLALNIIIKTQN